MSLQALPTELTMAWMSHVDHLQGSLASITRVSRKLNGIATPLLYKKLQLVNAPTTAAYCLLRTLLQYPGLRKRVRHIDFGAVNDDPPSSIVPWGDSYSMLNALRDMLGPEASKEALDACILWRSAMFSGRTGIDAFIVCVCEKIESVVYSTSEIQDDRICTFLELLRSAAHHRPTPLKLKTLDVTSKIDHRFPLFSSLESLSVGNATYDANVSLLAPLQNPHSNAAPTLHTIKLVQCDGGTGVLCDLLAHVALPSLRNITILEQFWGLGQDYQALIDRLAAGCKAVEYLELDFAYQDAEDDNITTPLRAHSFQQFTALTTLAVHRDLCYNRVDRNILQHSRHMLPSSLQILRIFGLHKVDLTDAIQLMPVVPITLEEVLLSVDVVINRRTSAQHFFVDGLRALSARWPQLKLCYRNIAAAQSQHEECIIPRPLISPACN